MTTTTRIRDLLDDDVEVFDEVAERIGRGELAIRGRRGAS